jgi:hypothetical protein
MCIKIASYIGCVSGLLCVLNVYQDCYVYWMCIRIAMCTPTGSPTRYLTSKLSPTRYLTSKLSPTRDLTLQEIYLLQDIYLYERSVSYTRSISARLIPNLHSTIQEISLYKRSIYYKTSIYYKRSVSYKIDTQLYTPRYTRSHSTKRYISQQRPNLQAQDK